MNSEEQPKIYTTINKDRKTYYTQKQGSKENNPNTLEYKLKELNDSKNNQIYRNNNTYIYKSSKNDSVNNSNINNTAQINTSNFNDILMNSQLTNQSKQSHYSKSKQNIPNNINSKTVNNQLNSDINNNNNKSNNKNVSKQKYSATVQIDEQSEMQKLLDLEKKNYANKFKDNAYKTVKDMNASSSSNNISNNNINNEAIKNRISTRSGNNNIINTCLINKDSNLDKNIKNYIDEKAEELKEFFHEEINNLHCDLIKQFEIQNTQNMKMLQEFSVLNKQMAEEIKRLKSENELLKENAS